MGPSDGAVAGGVLPSIRESSDSIGPQDGPAVEGQEPTPETRCCATRLGRSLSLLVPGRGEPEREEEVEATDSCADTVMPDASEELLGATRTARADSSYISRRDRTVSDAQVGYASKLPRQASVRLDSKRICLIDAVRAGSAGLRDGTYLFVVMLASPDHIRLMHEDDLVSEGVLAGHTSLVERGEFVRRWSRRWEDSDGGFRHTVLYAGELDYREGLGVRSWNNRSGHYMPDGADHVRVALDPDTFEAAD